MRIMIFSKEPKGERPHVHVFWGHGKGKARMKVWIDDIQIFKTEGVWPAAKMRLALDTIVVGQQYLLEQYKEKHG